MPSEECAALIPQTPLGVHKSLLIGKASDRQTYKIEADLEAGGSWRMEQCGGLESAKGLQSNQRSNQ